MVFAKIFVKSSWENIKNTTHAWTLLIAARDLFEIEDIEGEKYKTCTPSIIFVLAGRW